MMQKQTGLTTKAGIYRISDSKSGKFYIGSAANISKRWRYHEYRLKKGNHPNPIIQAIWNTDPARISIAVLQVIELPTREELLLAEQEHLNRADVGNNRACMNVLAVAGSHLGRKRTQDTIEKLRTANLGRVFSPETREKMRVAKLGKKLSPEHCRKLGDAARGKRINRPTGIINPALRRISPELLQSLKQRRSDGWSWSRLAKAAGINQSACRRAILGVTYKEVG